MPIYDNVDPRTRIPTVHLSIRGDSSAFNQDVQRLEDLRRSDYGAFAALALKFGLAQEGASAIAVANAIRSRGYEVLPGGGIQSRPLSQSEMQSGYQTNPLDNGFSLEGTPGAPITGYMYDWLVEHLAPLSGLSQSDPDFRRKFDAYLYDTFKISDWGTAKKIIDELSGMFPDRTEPIDPEGYLQPGRYAPLDLPGVPSRDTPGMDSLSHDPNEPERVSMKPVAAAPIPTQMVGPEEPIQLPQMSPQAIAYITDMMKATMGSAPTITPSYMDAPPPPIKTPPISPPSSGPAPSAGQQMQVAQQPKPLESYNPVVNPAPNPMTAGQQMQVAQSPRLVILPPNIVDLPTPPSMPLSQSQAIEEMLTVQGSVPTKSSGYNPKKGTSFKSRR